MKKFVSIILVAMMVCCLAVPAMAGEAFTATISDASACAGETVTLKVTVSQDIASVGSGKLDLSFANGLTLVSAEWLVDAFMSDFDADLNRGVFAFEGTETVSGDIMELVFKVSDDVEVGVGYVVMATIGLKDGENGDIPVEVTAGTVTVEETPCEHDFNTGWSKDADYHWHACANDCGEIADKAAHVYSSPCDKTCNVCGAARTVAHEFADEWVVEADSHWKVCEKCGFKTQVGPHMGTVLVGAVKVGCEEDGYTGDMYCVCGKLMTKGSSIPAIGHHYVNGVCVDCGVDENPETGDALALLIAVAVVSMGAAALTFKKRK